MQSNNKFVVGTQLGILSIFNRSKGWGDCVDRIPGCDTLFFSRPIPSCADHRMAACSHPSSIDALCAMTPDVILTGSSDGLIRAVEILPTKFLGIIADHGEFPIERIKLDREKKWLGSASHDEVLKLTDVGDALEDSDDDEDGKVDGEHPMALDADDKEGGGKAGLGDMSAPAKQGPPAMSDEDSDEPGSDQEQKRKKKRRKKGKNSMGSRKKASSGERSFFADL